jgi:hypothetical protein
MAESITRREQLMAYEAQFMSDRKGLKDKLGGMENLWTTKSKGRH